MFMFSVADPFPDSKFTFFVPLIHIQVTLGVGLPEAEQTIFRMSPSATFVVEGGELVILGGT
jgi:hypothetical protein